MKAGVRSGLLVALLLGGLPLVGAQAGETIYVPGIKIVLEVRTAQGQLRSFQRPGERPSYWGQGFPVVQGDRVTVVPLIATGGAELGEVRLRCDETPLGNKTEAPWRLEVDTAQWTVGPHQLEVWAESQAPHGRRARATTTLVVVAPDDRAVRETGDPANQQESLACVLGARDAELDRALVDLASVRLDKPELFFVAAGPAATEYFYTLSRDGKELYRSPLLPLATHLLLGPARPRADVGGRAPAVPVTGEGKSMLTVRAGDGTGRFGPPAWATVQFAGGEEVR